MGDAEARMADHVLTLVGPTVAEAVTLATAAVVGLGGTVGTPTWLAPGLACDVMFSGAAPASAEAAVRTRIAGTAVDLAVQPAEGRRKRLLVADMESTIITRELLDEIGRRAGLARQISTITERAMRGEIDFAGALRARVALLKGAPVALLDAVAGLIELSPGARTLVRTMRANGAYTVLVSGGFDRFSGLVRDACGFDADRANHLVVADGVITGTVAEPILDRDGKRAVLEALCRERGLATSAVAAIGDGANDIAMIAAAGLGTAYRGKPAVKAATRFHIDHTDLTTLLYFQGYKENEFKK
jgi:phosphoserine phosphatase